jgi:hypothetical protein
MSDNRFRLLVFIMFTASLVMTVNAIGRPNIQIGSHLNKQGLLKTTASCYPATAAIDMDINNVRARYMTGGDMWWNIGAGVAEYVVPKNGTASSQFAASCWIGGFDPQKQLKVAAQTYRQDGNDYWPGALNEVNDITAAQCSDWDYIWKINKSDILAFIALGPGGATANKFPTIFNWPAVPDLKGGFPGATGTSGGTLNFVAGHTYAPFVDVDGDGVYNPNKGDYPKISGDQFLWWVFNDKGNVKLSSQTSAIGVEVQTSAFAYSSQDFLNNATFCNYRVINRGALTIDSTYIAVFDDMDLGYAFDDYIGCDTVRGLGIGYNGSSVDGTGQVNAYGPTPPMVGVDFFQGPIRIVDSGGRKVNKQLSMTSFTYFINNSSPTIGNPTNGVGIYYYMTGSTLNGSRFSDDFKGPGVPSRGYGSGPATNFVYFGEPSDNTQWSECACHNTPDDRRFIESSGPFTLFPGALNDITFGCVWAPGIGGCPSTSFKTIQSIDDQAQALFDNNFKQIEGPEAPRMVVRALDRHIAVYLVNDYGSNNYKEQFGRSDSLKYHQPVVKASKVLHNPDSLYKFEGYRVFQLADGSVSPASIYGPDGQVDASKAVQIFECDIHDSITKLVNYVKRNDLGGSTGTGSGAQFQAQLKVSGKDSGIVHSFEVTQDAFATGNDKTLVNYKSYYFVALAYAYNDFSYHKLTGISGTGGFDPNNVDVTQDIPYLESAHGEASSPLQVIAVIPNPSNGDMGTVINSDYGSGVIIKRIEGTGNGGNALDMDQVSEDSAVKSSNYIVQQPTYLQGAGPINVKVVDPVAVKPMDWQLSVIGVPNTILYDKGLIGNKSYWKLTGVGSSGNVTIYSEDSLNSINEQILSDYGISVSVNQVSRPGENPSNGNGYITSSVNFVDASKPWLAGVQDGSDSSIFNWQRSGSDTAVKGNLLCFYQDYKYDLVNAFGNMLNNYTLTKSTWSPYALAATWPGIKADTTALTATCEFAPAYPGSVSVGGLNSLPSVDIVFTNDKSKWSVCPVLEMEGVSALSQGHAQRFTLRRHNSWTGLIDNAGSPIYQQNGDYDKKISSVPDQGFSEFPGYAINQETGERLNIFFGEDSWLTSDNGGDMIWNPTSTITNPFDQSLVFGGKHFVYVLGSRYDTCAAFTAAITSSNPLNKPPAFASIQWVGLPTISHNVPLLSLKDNLIPTETKLRFRVTRPYAFFNPAATDAINLAAPNNPNPPGGTQASGLPNNGYPFYTFSTRELAPTPVSDNTNKNAVLDRINVVPNPYYGYSHYETSRLDTKVRIINLPAKAEIYIYSLDGSLVRTLTKSDPNSSYIDWDIRNSIGLSIASGMYIIDIKADGLGEKVLRWFGATRPIDVTTY